MVEAKQDFTVGSDLASLQGGALAQGRTQATSGRLASDYASVF